MKTAKAFSPGHITGLFFMCLGHEDPLFNGSLGAGVSLSRGVTTHVSCDEAFSKGISISINGQKRSDAIVSKKVLDLFFSGTGLSLNGRLRVNHVIDIPQGSGFGSSGAAALSLSIALNELFKTNISIIEAAQIAHVAEIECSTGLGTVLGEMAGGLKISTVPGAPGIGKTKPISYSENLSAIFLTFGKYPTSSALKNPDIRETINSNGRKYLEKLEASPSLSNFLYYSREFADSINLISSRVRGVLDDLDIADIMGSMLMFGEAVFTIVDNERLEKVVSIYKKHIKTASIMTTTVSEDGGYLIA